MAAHKGLNTESPTMEEHRFRSSTSIIRLSGWYRESPTPQLHGSDDSERGIISAGDLDFRASRNRNPICLTRSNSTQPSRESLNRQDGQDTKRSSILAPQNPNNGH